jgi:hypothetical protein
VSGKTVAQKLLIKSGHRIAVLHSPAGYAAVLEPLPDGAAIAAEPASLDAVLTFVQNLADVDARLATARAAVKHDGLLWIAYPKGGTKADTDLNRDKLWQYVEQFALQGVALIAIDDTWSAMRFRPTDRVGKGR